uniref:Dystonin n=2 Tax=Arion vulgaris TaxID=1028688 RepID=A0A0B7BLJ0_9EUPU
MIAPSVASVQETGSQLLSGLSGKEHTKMDTELNSLDSRWTALTSNVTQRMKTLEDTSELAKIFQDIHEPLSSWLDVTDKRFASLEPKSPNAGGIEKLISDLKNMQVEVSEREDSVKELTALGKRLQDFCKGEDVAIVQIKIDGIQKQFSDLKNKVDDSLEQMEEALPLARNFQDAHEKFVEWLSKVEPELRGKEPAWEDAEEKVQALLEELETVQPYLDIINNEGAELAEVAPGDAGLHVEEMISKDNKRYEGVRQQIEKRAEKVKMTRRKSLECINELDELLDWFDKGEDKLNNMSSICAEPDKLQKQLAEIKSFNEEVNNQKVNARDAVTTGKKLLRDSNQNDVAAIQEKIDKLKNKSQMVTSLTAERLSDLEQALPLAKSFSDTHDNLITWLDEVEPALAELEVTTVDANEVRKQHDSIKALKKDVADHKPVIDRLNKAGSALVQLVSPEAALDVQNKLDDDNKRVENVRGGVRERSNSIDAAMQQSVEFTDKLEDMLETLTTTAETIQHSEPISAHPDKIREQIEENKIVHEDMQMKSDAFDSVKEAADELIKQAGDASDPAVRDVRQKLEELTRLYSDIQNNCHDRSRALEDALAVSEKFWEDLHTLSGNIKELQDGLNNQEKPALEPEAIREQQEELEAFKDDLASTQADLEDLQETGDQLMSFVGDPERPEVRKNLNDTEETVHNINSRVDQRSKDLDAALSKAITFQEELQKMIVWLQTHEDTFNMMEPVASDLETITSQWNDIKVFKGIVDPKHVEVEILNQQVEELTRDCTVEQAIVVREPVIEVNQRWDDLQANIGDRQRDIQMALLNLGQFDQAFKDFKSWLENVDTALDELKPIYCDSKVVEMELAKLRVITNDIAAHQHSMDLLSEEAAKIMTKERPPEASKLKKKMDSLVKDWNKVKEKSAKKQSQLEDAKREARNFTEKLQGVLMKISDLDGQMITSQPVGGLPETAKEQLQAFMKIYEEIEKLESEVQGLQDMSVKLAAKDADDPAANLSQSIAVVHNRWNHAMGRAVDRKKKLEDAVGLAGNFHEELTKFIGWLTDTEKTLNNLHPVSRLVDKVTKQIEDHRVLQKDVSGHRETMFALDKMGTHLKYFSQKQDIVLIKNLLSSAQHRWEKIVSRSAERTRHLEKGYKEAKQFYDSWKDLIQWLTDAEQALNSETTISNEPEKIRSQIAKHKEFQRRLGAKQPVYDSISRAGSTLQTRCPSDDKPAIQALLADLKGRWNAVCGRSVDRQRKLEEGLLFTGQFNEALEALLDWLAKVEPTLAEDTQVHGDLDTVNGFLEAHKAFQQELGARATTVQFVRKSAKDLIEKSSEDMSQVQSQLIELSTLWDRTCKLSVNKQERLAQAHRLADEFHNKAQGLLDWLANAERQLRFKGVIPDEEAAIILQIDDHKKFEEQMLRQEATLRETLNIGQDIMKRCHPEALSTMKHWLGVLRTRWEELMGLSKHRQKKLTEALANARLNSTLLEEMLAWLNAGEVKLTDLDKETIPKDLQIVQDLMSQHQDFQNEMSSKQPSVDRLTKADKRKGGSDPSSHIPIFRGSRNLSKSKIPTIRIDRVDSGGRKTPDCFGRRTPEHFSGHRIPIASGRKTPDVSGRKTPDHSGRRTPDRSGRRTPDYSSGRRTPDYHSGRRTPEPGFHNPRVGALFNKWRHVWLLSMYRQRKLQDALDYLNELERLKSFEFEEWRKRYLLWMNHNKARIMDFFRRQDRDRDGRVTRQEFIDGILQSKFPTSRLEMEAVADIFDKDGDGFINYKEFVAALRPDRDPKPETDSEKIMDEVRRQVSKCTCVKQFKIHKIGEGKYRFGDSQKLRLVRILRSTVMVRVGGGWIALDEFLVKNDPCRVGLWRRKQFRLKRRYLHQNTEEPKGRTNMELREQFILAEGVSQAMSGFVTKSPAGSSHSSGSSYSGRSNSTASGPVTKIREKTVNQTPWRQTKTSADGEVHQIMSHTHPDGSKVIKHKVTQELKSPRNIASPASRSSSRASTGSGSRPTSRTGSEAAEDNQEVYTTVQAEKQNVGGRKDTTVTYQTHVVQTRNVTLPTVTSTKISRIPKVSPTKKK